MNIQLHRERVSKKPYLQIKVPVLIGEDTLQGEMMSDFLIEGERDGIDIEIKQQGEGRENVAILSIKEVDKIKSNK